MENIKLKKKTAHIHLMVSPDVKRNLREKAEQEGLDLTQFIEKIANEKIITIPKNIKVTLEVIN